MRPEFDSEIDSVLRGHARRGGALPGAWDAAARLSIPGGSLSGSHLDADEIAAFGEDALPAAARARYSAHLADCDDCRRSVTQVAFAAGVAERINERAGAAAGVAERADEQARAVAAAAATRSPAAATQSPASASRPPFWRERLSSIFAPRAWRYAMPVVALFAVGTVVFVLMNDRLREGASEMARQGGNAEQRTAAPAAPAGSEAHHADAKQQPGLPVEAQPGDTGTTAGVAPAYEKSEAAAAGGELAKTGPKVAEGADQSAPIGAAAGAQAEAVRVTAADAARQPDSENYVTSTTPVPVSPPPAPRTTIARDGFPQPSPAPLPPVVEQEMRARGGEESRPAAAPRDEAPATKRHGPQRSAAGRAGELSSSAEAMKDDRASARRARGPATNAANNREANRNDADESKSKREEDRDQQQQRAETRAVAGRRFRREGNAWIDTSYRSGQATVVVRRNSEQYRKLVASAPEIGNVSRTFGGEVVVVWGARAYRIKP